MARPRYRMAKEDVKMVHRWIRDRFRTAQWPEDWPELTAWDMFPLDNPTARKLQQWCDRFLNAAQWKQVHAVIRAARRDMSQYRTVRFSRRAHDIVHQLAQREQVTLSAVIERYLSDVANTPAAALTGPVSQPPVAAKNTWVSSTPKVVADTIQRDIPGTLSPRVMKVELYLAVENNSKFVRGKKKAREEIEWHVLRRYQMKKPQQDGEVYLLTIPYHTDEELDRIIYDDILRAAADIADDLHCFTEADVRSLGDPDRSW